MLALLAPGQGSQSVGMLGPWLELDGLTARATALGEAVGFDLVGHGTRSDETTIKDIAVAQPLIVAAGLLTAPLVLGATGLDALTAVAGHSVGEVTAAAIAGVFTDTEALRFVASRAAGMAAASAASATGMSAVLGGDPTQVLALLESLGLSAANINGAGQIVAAGRLDQLAQLAANPPAKTRIIALRVAGAFHTAHMASAIPPLADFAATLSPADPAVVVVSNADGAALRAGTQILARLVRQVTTPVRWDLCTQRLQAMKVTGVIELAPAGTLVGLAKRGLPGVETLAVKSPADLDAAHRMIREHATPVGSGA